MARFSIELETGGVIEEGPGDFVFAGEVGGEVFDAEGFGGVVAAVEDVETEFFGEGEGPVRAFTGDEGVHTLASGSGQAGASAAGHDSNVAAFFWAARNDGRRVAEDFLQAVGKVVAIEVGGGAETDVLLFFKKEGVEFFQLESGSEASAIAEFRMGIEGEVGTINGEVVAEEFFKELIFAARPGETFAPK